MIVTLNVSAFITGDLAAQPPLAAFGQVKRADAASRVRRVLIQGKEEALAKLQVSSLSSAVQAKIIVAIQGTRTRLLLPISAFYSEPGEKSNVPSNASQYQRLSRSFR